MNREQIMVQKLEYSMEEDPECSEAYNADNEESRIDEEEHFIGMDQRHDVNRMMAEKARIEQEEEKAKNEAEIARREAEKAQKKIERVEKERELLEEMALKMIRKEKYNIVKIEEAEGGSSGGEETDDTLAYESNSTDSAIGIESFCVNPYFVST